MGSSDIVQWISQGYLAGDPVATALFIPLFFVVNLWNLATGGPVL